MRNKYTPMTTLYTPSGEEVRVPTVNANDLINAHGYTRDKGRPPPVITPPPAPVYADTPPPKPVAETREEKRARWKRERENARQLWLKIAETNGIEVDENWHLSRLTSIVSLGIEK